MTSICLILRGVDPLAVVSCLKALKEPGFNMVLYSSLIFILANCCWFWREGFGTMFPVNGRGGAHIQFSYGIFWLVHQSINYVLQNLDWKKGYFFNALITLKILMWEKINFLIIISQSNQCVLLLFLYILL